MTIQELREMSPEELNKELLALRREQFNLRVQRATSQMPKPHNFSRVRKTIARIKTLMNEQTGAQS